MSNFPSRVIFSKQADHDLDLIPFWYHWYTRVFRADKILITPVKLPSSSIKGVLEFYREKVNVVVRPLYLENWDARAVWDFQREQLKGIISDERKFLAISADTDQFFEPVTSVKEDEEIIVFKRLNFLAGMTPTIGNISDVDLIPLDSSRPSLLHAVTDYVAGFVNRLDHRDIFLTGHYRGRKDTIEDMSCGKVEFHLRLRGIEQFINKIKALSFDSLDGPLSRHFKDWVNILRCSGEEGLIREYHRLVAGAGACRSTELERLRSLVLRGLSDSTQEIPSTATDSSEISSSMVSKSRNNSPSVKKQPPRLLVFNCHEAWVYQLAGLPFGLDIIVGLRGRLKASWDEQMRPIPENARLVELKDILRSPSSYYCIIAHNITDLLDVKSIACPRLLMLHSTIEGRSAEEASRVSAGDFAQMVSKYVKISKTHAVACSPLKARSWGITDDILVSSADVSDYMPHTSVTAAGLRICNHINRRRKILCWDFHDKAFGGLPVTLVGHNPDIPGVSAAQNWGELKEIFQRHRFYIHTADPIYEDGFNMATMEAMAAGLPVLGNRHPTSPVTDGIDGHLSDDPDELRARAEELIADPKLAHRMGQAAMEKAIKVFSRRRFHEGLIRSIDIARATWSGVTGN